MKRSGVETLWRISNHCDLDGLGGERSPGRWHTAARGRRIVYLAEHPALVLVEVLANLKANPKLLPDRYQLMKVQVSETPVETAVVQSGWQNRIPETQSQGNAWLAGRQSALLAVPSATVPESWNYLLNPLHGNAKNCTVAWCRWAQYDQRLLATRE